MKKEIIMEPTKSPFTNGENKETGKAYSMENLILLCSLIFSFFVIPKYSNITIQKILYSFLLFVGMSFLLYLFFYIKQMSFLKYLSFYINPQFAVIYILGFIIPIIIIITCFINISKPLLLFHFNYYFFLWYLSSRVTHKRYKYILGLDGEKNKSEQLDE